MTAPRNIPEPPPGVAIRVENLDEGLRFSGEHWAQAVSEPLVLSIFVRGFLKVWTGLVLAGIPLGAVFIGACAVLAVRQDGWAELPFWLGFLFMWVLIGIFMYFGGRFMRSRLDLLLGKAPLLSWQLTIERDAWRARVVESLVPTEDHQLDPHDVEDITVTNEDRLIARVRDLQNQRSRDLVLTGPLEEAEAEWLRSVLVGRLGLRRSS